MAEAMIPHEMRPKIECKGRPNVISMDSPQRIKRKKSSSNVVIAIPAEIKRHKNTSLGGGYAVRRIIEDISTAVTRKDRLSAIGAACASFNHYIATDHDNEIQNHFADSALCKHLSFLLLKEHHNPAKKQIEQEELKKWEKNEDYQCRSLFDEADEEIGYTCSALEMVYRGSATIVSKSFEKLGPELLDLLLAVIYRKARNEKDVSLKNTKLTSGSADLSIQKATKIMCHLARAGSTVEAIAYHPGILRVLTDIIGSKYETLNNQVFDAHIINDEISINCLWILGNLACAPENMSHIITYPGLQKSLLNVIKSSDTTNTERINSPTFAKRIAVTGQAIRIFLNLSWTDENKIRLSENHEMIDEIIKLVSFSHHASNKRIDDLILSTRRHAMGTLRNIAAISSSIAKQRLCQLDDSIILQVLLKLITDKFYPRNAAEGCKEDLVMKEIAVATIYNLISKETVNTIALHDGLFKTLSDISTYPEKDLGDIPKLVEKSLISLKENVKSGMECYEIIMGTKEENQLEVISSSMQIADNGDLMQYASI